LEAVTLTDSIISIKVVPSLLLEEEPMSTDTNRNENKEGMRNSQSKYSYSNMAIASLGTGIASLAIIPPFIFGILAVIFGVIDIRKARQSGIKIHRMTLAGIALGIIGLILGIVLRIWL
jgi:translation elongation factor EF-1beta